MWLVKFFLIIVFTFITIYSTLIPRGELMEEIREIIRQNLERYIKTSQYTQADIARLLDVSKPPVTYWIKGTISPNIELLDKLCILLGISINDIFSSYPTNPPLPALAPDEQKLIDDYRTLNDQGKEHIRVCMASAQALFKESGSNISSLESKSS